MNYNHDAHETYLQVTSISSRINDTSPLSIDDQLIDKSPVQNTRVIIRIDNEAQLKIAKIILLLS